MKLKLFCQNRPLHLYYIPLLSSPFLLSLYFSLLPLSHPFSLPPIQGPFVLVDELIELIMRSPVPDVPSSSSNSQTSEAGGAVAQKRRREEGDVSDEEGEGPPPSHDVYRSRQQKRIHTTT